MEDLQKLSEMINFIKVYVHGVVIGKKLFLFLKRRLDFYNIEYEVTKSKERTCNDCKKIFEFDYVDILRIRETGYDAHTYRKGYYVGNGIISHNGFVCSTCLKKKKEEFIESLKRPDLLQPCKNCKVNLHVLSWNMYFGSIKMYCPACNKYYKIENGKYVD